MGTFAAKQVLPLDAASTTAPAFVGALAFVEVEEGLLVDGLREPLLIEIPAAQRQETLRLLRLVDGRRTLAELALQASGLSFDYVARTISTLAQSGFVAYGPREGCHGPAYDFFTRLAISEGASAPDLLSRLAGAEILLATPQSDATILDVLPPLTRGIDSTMVYACGASELARILDLPAARERVMIAASLHGEDPFWFRSVNQTCRDRGVPWLRVTLDPAKREIDVGPMFLNGPASPCYDCFQAIHKSDNDVPGSSSRCDVAQMVSRVMVEAIMMISLGQPRLYDRRSSRRNMDSGQETILYTARLAGCTACQATPLHAPHEAGLPEGLRLRPPEGVDVSVLYEDYARVRTPSHTPPAVMAERYRQLARETRDLSLHEQIPLPPEVPVLTAGLLALLQRGAEKCRHILTLADVTVLVTLSAGLREPVSQGSKLQRWTAAAGNLGSVEPFIVALNVGGLKPGIYRYDVHRHCFAMCPQAQTPGCLEAILQNGVRLAVAPAALIVLSSAYDRLRKKYGDYSFRLENFDAGVACAQIEVVAAALGLQAERACLWADDLLASELGLTEQQAHCTAAIGLSDRKAGDSSHRTCRPLLHSSRHSRLQRSAFCGMSRAEITNLTIHSSRVAAQDLVPNKVCPSTLSSVVRGRYGVAWEPLFGHTESTSVLSAGEVLRKRRSVRRFAPDPLEGDKVLTILNIAAAYLDIAATGTFLDLAVMVQRVTSISPGVYQYDPCLERVRSTGPVPARDAGKEFFEQEGLATAAVTFFLLGDVNAVSDRYGSYGYRMLLLEAGELAQRMWLAALSVGLDAGLIAGIDQDAAYKFLHATSPRRSSLLALAVGYGW